MKKYLVTLVLLLIGIGCFTTYSIIGSDVAPDGTLVEPFFLIPVGYLFMFVGIIIGLIVSMRSLFHKNLN